MKRFFKLSILALAIFAGNIPSICAEKIHQSKTDQEEAEEKHLQIPLENLQEEFQEETDLGQKNKESNLEKSSLIKSWNEKLKNGEIATFEFHNSKLLDNKKKLAEMGKTFKKAFSDYSSGFDINDWKCDEKNFRNREELFIIAKIDEKIVGFNAFYFFYYNKVIIDWLVVDLERQGQGLGKKLIFSIFKLYTKISQIILDATSESEEFYSHIGFKKSNPDCEGSIEFQYERKND